MNDHVLMLFGALGAVFVAGCQRTASPPVVHQASVVPDASVHQEPEPQPPASQAEKPKAAESPAELEDALCGPDCRVSERLEVADGLFLIRTEPIAPTPANEWPEPPSYWFVEFDNDEHPLRFQKLFHGYLEGSEPKEDGLWSIFRLEVLPSSGQFRLAGREPSPSGTAWGRNGEVIFTWPELHFISWTYSWFHILNSSLSGTITWDWRTSSGTREFPTASFDFVVPQFSLNDEFREGAWKNADFSTCSAHFIAAQGHHPSRRNKALHEARVVLSDKGELFVELLPKPASGANSLKLKVCFSGEFERAESPPTNQPSPPCVDGSGQVSGELGDVAVNVESSGNRYKFVLPEDVSALSLVIEDRVDSAETCSSEFDFKSEQSLGPTAPFDKKRVTCELVDTALVPRFGPYNSKWALMDQAPWQ